MTLLDLVFLVVLGVLVGIGWVLQSGSRASQRSAPEHGPGCAIGPAGRPSRFFTNAT